MPQKMTMMAVSPITAHLLSLLRERLPGQATADHLIAMLAAVAQVAATVAHDEPQGWAEDLAPKLRTSIKHLAAVIESDDPAATFEAQLDEARKLMALRDAPSDGSVN